MAHQPPAGAHKREVLLVLLCSLFMGFFVTAELLGAKLSATMLRRWHPNCTCWTSRSTGCG